jgi:hypothetical protein
MSEAAFIVILQALIAVFPPFAALLLRYLPDDDAEPLVGKIRGILPVDGASTKARQQLEDMAADTLDPLDEDSV